MAIHIEKNNTLFRIVTKNTEYQMKVDGYGVLKHLWYGEKTGCDMEYLQQYPEISFSGSIYDAGNDRSYSLNTLPLEYSATGNGDFRTAALRVKHLNGTEAVDLRFESVNARKGKYGIEGLPAVYADNSEAETLEIILKDSASDIRVKLLYGVLEELDIITRCAVIENMGENSVFLEKAASLSLDIHSGNLEWIHFHGRHAMERIVERAPLIHGIQESGSNRGASSHQQNPTVILCSPDCSETAGNCIGAALMYSGSFKTEVMLDEINQARLVMGINSDLFRWELKKGKCFHTPEVILSYSGKGLEALSHNFHKVIRENVCRGKYKLCERPVLINNWEATYFDFDNEKILNIAKQAAESGVDMLVLDDGWFGKRNNDCSGLGDWYVNESKIKGGLGNMVKQITDMGMKFGIWFEPEMISEDSDLYRAHSDWAIKMPSRNPIRSRFQLVLDLTKKQVRDYLFEAISDILNSADISYVKWDFNRHITDWYSSELSADNQGEMPHRYILGLYGLLERLTAAFPNVLFEGCSGGGGRFDAGMLFYTPQIWCSDDTDAFERTRIQYGTSFFYPISAVGSHISTVPNHQTGRVTPFETRGVVAMAGSFGYELDLNRLSEDGKYHVREQIKRFKEYGPLIHGGKYCRLTDPFTDNISAWEFVSDNKEEVLVQGMIYRTEPTIPPYSLKIRGLKEGASYKAEGDDTVYTAEALMKAGLVLPRTWGDYVSFEKRLFMVK